MSTENEKLAKLVREKQKAELELRQIQKQIRQADQASQGQ